VRTGTVVCLCKGSDRSLVANIGAALKCEKKFVDNELGNFTTDPKFYYIEGFFIPDKMDICRSVYERYSTNPNCQFITNLNAPYIIKNFQKDITWMVKKADVVFGNRDEFEELAKINGFDTMEDLFTELFASYSNKLIQKKIVVTDGSNDVVFYKGDANGIESGSVNVPEVSKKEIVDTTGAGDSFVAGFIYELLRGKDIRECIEVGINISSQVIRVIGCNLPTEQ
jgi:adenosine kinase